MGTNKRGHSENSKQTRFSQGHKSLAPTGKKEKRTITNSIKKLLEREIAHVDFFNEESRQEFLSDAIAERMLKRAYEGDVRAMNAILDRVEGPVTQKIENVSQGPDPEKQKEMFEKLTPKERETLMKLMEKMNA